MSKLIITAAFVSFLFAQNQLCNKSNESREIFNVNKKVELVFFYKKESSRAARDHFFENVLNRPVNGGHWPRDGVQALFGIDRNGHEGFGITFFPEATPEQREEIKKILDESSLVHKVFVNIAPVEINDL